METIYLVPRYGDNRKCGTCKYWSIIDGYQDKAVEEQVGHCLHPLMECLSDVAKDDMGPNDGSECMAWEFKVNLKWVVSEHSESTLDCYNDANFRLAHITERPNYCDRGHYHANIEIGLGLDAADMFPRYYMQLETAVRETELFLIWRMHKIRFESLNRIQQGHLSGPMQV